MPYQLTHHLKLDLILFRLTSIAKLHLLICISFMLQCLDEVIFNILHQSQFSCIERALPMNNFFHNARYLQLIAVNRFFTVFFVFSDSGVEGAFFLQLHEGVALELLNGGSLFRVHSETFLDEADKLARDAHLEELLHVDDELF